MAMQVVNTKILSATYCVNTVNLREMQSTNCSDLFFQKNGEEKKAYRFRSMLFWRAVHCIIHCSLLKSWYLSWKQVLSLINQGERKRNLTQVSTSDSWLH